MAKGDIIAGRIAGAGAFQPAAGVEVMITALTNYGNVTSNWGINAGAVDDYFVSVATMSPTYSTPGSYKIGVTNSATLQTAQGGAYSGVQVK